jgi:hypothetical protein
MKTILAAAIAGSSLLVTTVQASAHDYDRWDRWDRKHSWKHSRGYGPPERVVERRVVVERPVYVAPRPVYVAPVAPMVPAYGYGGGGGYPQDPSVNFNFSFPMR